MPARKRSRADLLPQLRPTPGPLSCYRAEKDAGPSGSASATTENDGTAEHGPAQFFRGQQIGFGGRRRGRAGGNRVAAGITSADQDRAAASGSRLGKRSVLSEAQSPRIFTGPNQRLSRLSIDQ